ncbi:MAG TPA: helix-turn-helix transcriptional regulator [Burkholderiales bacterium]
MARKRKEAARARSRAVGAARAGARNGAGVRLAAPATEAELHALLARRVRAAREQRFMSRKQLAQQSGISLAYLARIESGTGNISLGLLHKLAVALNLPIESFLAPEETHSADFTVIVEFLKRQSPEELARIRRQLFASAEGPANGEARRVALVGIRGVGKSTLGPRLAEFLGVPFVELNREIEREAGLAVSEIFMLYGQQGYRQLERRCLERVIVRHPRVVLATGGGIVTEPATYELLLNSFFTVWLKARPQVMFARVLAQHDARIASPRLRSEALENIVRTYEARRHLYELAHASLDTSNKTVDQAVRALLALLPADAPQPRRLRA